MVAFNLQSGHGAPIGSVIAYAGIIDENQQVNTTGTINNIEAYGWVVCDGRILECNQYPELFQSIGFLYTKNPPASMSNMPSDQTFNVPDYRGYFLRGDGSGTTNDPDISTRTFVNGSTVPTSGNKIGSLEQDALQSHKHTYSDASTTTAAATGTNTTAVAVETTTPTSIPTDATDSPSGNEAVRISIETRPINMYVNYLIKAIYINNGVTIN